MCGFKVIVRPIVGYTGIMPDTYPPCLFDNTNKAARDRITFRKICDMVPNEQNIMTLRAFVWFNKIEA